MLGGVKLKYLMLGEGDGVGLVGNERRMKWGLGGEK